MKITTQYIALSFLVFVILLHPLIVNYKMEPKGENRTANQITTAVKTAFLVSLFPTAMFYNTQQICVFSILQWHLTPSMTIGVSFIFDHLSVPFTSVALFVSWAIFQFALWYMQEDPRINQFFKYLLTFLLMMLIFISANNLFQLFLGWEGMGIMSFLLIGWWHGRADANTAAVQAFLYNRVGDFGFFTSLAALAATTALWDISSLMAYPATQINLTILGVIVAACAKSAQFGLHPWLADAMEGPTPVSALLHSSTMVVAGIFLLIRLNILIFYNPSALTMCLCLGALTSLFAATCALTQNDIKKIIAYSTSSQLGLMMVAVGLAHPDMALLHMTTHAFFKAMLFLCAGAYIHMLDNEQDIRKMGGLGKLAPFTSSCFVIGSLALMGTPFLSAFYSKDSIIEALNVSNLNACALAFTLIATAFTAVYSLRLIYYVIMGRPRFSLFLYVNEKESRIYHPLKRLALGSVFMGMTIAATSIWSIHPVMTLPTHIKIMALVLTVVSLLIALALSLAAKNLVFPPKRAFHRFSNTLGYIPITIHRDIPHLSLKYGLDAADQLDKSWLENLAPKMFARVSLKMTSLLTNVQQGRIKVYLTLFTLMPFLTAFVSDIW
uniref:NADH dehydrogenase subunit 5 n=1 Tax=Laemonema goodebeanorum TaxID=630676 RepID=UPI0028FC8B8A|nr:NADH dehydrogenase subunit 5 [Laemonema goodebeanorum]WNH37753.1 NADH dehydrogenase subunit 5 [Laemonema goodebeanorum]